jgi:nicotinate-nucleotide pyrophosphorylase (carboxylating)
VTLRIPARLTAPEAGWVTSADVIVVGSGIAGLTAALCLRQRVDRVLLVTKTVLAEGSTRWAQGGIAAALDPADSPDEHLHDTLMAGAGVCDPEAVRILVSEGPARVRELVALGAEFDREPDGKISLTREGGHRRDRIAHAGGDATGKEISRALIAALHAVEDDPGIEVLEHALVVDLLQDRDARVCGVTLHVIGEGQIDGVGAARARAVVFATGGIGQVYSATTNPSVATGDGLAAALRAGAVIADLEFVQFHPTVLWLGEGSSGQQPLISEAVRGEGAYLVDRDGVRFMQGVHDLADLAPRDVVARAIVARMAQTDADHVYLDARHLGKEFLESRFPSIVARCRELGFDPVSELLPVAPAQHYASGGVLTDLVGRTSLAGLYACGEVSCTGVHGANRLASNSLLEGLVFAHRIADDITARLSAGDLEPAEPLALSSDTTLVASKERTEVQRAMTLGTGAVRSADSMARATRTLGAIAEAAQGLTADPGSWETSNLLHVGQLLTAAATLREETRGGHVRSDFTDRDDAHWLGHIHAVREGDGSITTSFQPITAQVSPAPHTTGRPPHHSPGHVSNAFPEKRARVVVEGALDEDLGGYPGLDLTSSATIPVTHRSTAHVVARAGGVAAGIPLISMVFRAVAERFGSSGVEVELFRQDGEAVNKGDVIGILHGSTRAILVGERTMLNLISRLSGIATHTRQWADALEGTGAMVLDTRKTTPGLRALEKYAVRCGGGTNKRMGLYDVAMVKDNHKVAAGSVSAAFEAVHRQFPAVDIQVEVTTTAEALEAVAAGARFLLCDNMSVHLLRTTVEVVRATDQQVEIEATGGLTLEVARAYAETGVNFLSVGGLTHSSPILDIALDLVDDKC